MLSTMLLALSDAATTGLFVLAGVLIGALSSALVQHYFEWRREQADIRQAKRLVAGEVVRVSIHYDGLVELGVTPSKLGGEPRFLPDAMWREHRATLARHLDDDSYDLLSLFMEALPTTRGVLASLPSAQPLPDDFRKIVEHGRDLCREAYRVLTGKSLDELPERGTEGGGLLNPPAGDPGGEG